MSLRNNIGIIESVFRQGVKLGQTVAAWLLVVLMTSRSSSEKWLCNIESLYKNILSRCTTWLYELGNENWGEAQNQNLVQYYISCDERQQWPPAQKKKIPNTPVA